MQAQARRVLAILEKNSDDMHHLISLKKPKTGPQWGRGGGRFLDPAGYWLKKLLTAVAMTDINVQLNQFLDDVNHSSEIETQLMDAKSFIDVALLAQKNSFDLKAVDLLAYQAQKILFLNEQEAQALADHSYALVKRKRPPPF